MTLEELLKEVGEPVLYAELAEEPHALFTFDQVAAAILKATKPMEDQLAAAQEEIRRLEKLVISAQNAAIENGVALKSTQDQLSKAEQRVAEWQPIETAPKDGSVIVVGYGRQSNFPAKVVYWKEIHKIWMHYGEWEPGLENNATHWMPLPKAPNNPSS